MLENKHLLNKILKNRTRKFEGPSESYHLAIHERRNREIEKINVENKKIAQRITNQYSTIQQTLVSLKNRETSSKNEKKTTVYASWNHSPMKPRKLPKLIHPSDRPTSKISHSDNGASLDSGMMASKML